MKRAATNLWQREVARAARISARPQSKPKPEKIPKEPTVPPPEIWAVDFDGTLCENRWPSIGLPNHDIIDILKKAKRNGKKLILWTCREDTLLEEALLWCRGFGLEFDAVNDNLPEVKEMYGSNPRKISAKVYLDDRAYWANGELERLWEMA